MYLKPLFQVFFGLALSLSGNQALAAKTKKNVCSITINSNDEIELFKKNLSDQDFNFIELTLNKGKEGSDASSDWLKASCQQGITCDMLVISGHFGGSFFGHTGISLALETLEVASCDNSCAGVLHSPKEVFLFGCNTLAGKSQDNRTPEQYVDVLVQDGFSRIQAQQVAAFRYSALGSSFHDRMSRIFSKVPRIYGFSSVAPSGKSIAPFLTKYLKGSGASYFEYLANLSSEINTPLHNNLKYMSFAQTKGANNQNTPVCYIQNKNLKNEAKLTYILDVLNKGGVLELAPYLVDYFNQLGLSQLTTNETDLVNRIYAHPTAKEKLMSFVSKPVDGLAKPQVDILNLMMKLKWISNEAYDDAVGKIVLSPLYSNKPITMAIADQLCSVNMQLARIAPDKIAAQQWKNGNLYKALKCLKPKNPELMEVLSTQFLELAKEQKFSNKNSGAFDTLMQILGDAKFENTKIYEGIVAALPYDNYTATGAIYSYIDATQTTATPLRQAFDSFYKKQVGKKKDLWQLVSLMHLMGRNDKAYLRNVLENYLNEKNPDTGLRAASTLNRLANASAETRKILVDEVMSGQDENRIKSALLLLGKLSQPIPSLLTRLSEIVSGNNPGILKALSLKLLKTWSLNNPAWDRYFLDLYKNSSEYQLKQAALKALEARRNVLTEEQLLALRNNEQNLAARRIMYQMLSQRNIEKYPYQSMTHEIEHASQAVKDLNSGKMPFTITAHSAKTLQESENDIGVVNAVIGLRLEHLDELSYPEAYGLVSENLIVNKKTNVVIAIAEKDDDRDIEVSIYDAKSRLLVLSQTEFRDSETIAIFTLHEKNDTVVMDYSEAFKQFKTETTTALRKEKAKYAQIFDAVDDPEYSYYWNSDKKSYLVSIIASERRGEGFFGADAKIQLVPGKNGKGTVRLIEKKVIAANL